MNTKSKTVRFPKKSRVLLVLILLIGVTIFIFAYLVQKANVAKGSSRPHDQKVGKITWKDVEEIAKIKLPDLNAFTIEKAKNSVAGSARSMGIDVVD